MKGLLMATVWLAICSRVLTDQDSPEDQQDFETTRGKATSSSNVLEINDLDELMTRVGQTGTLGSVVMICGKDLKMENHCKGITEAFKSFHEVYPHFKQEFIYYNLNKGDLRISRYFDVERIPHIMFIKDRRIYTYRHKTFSIKSLASFIHYFENNPNVMWREFPTRQRTTVDYYVEALYRLQDRIYLLCKGAAWAIYCVYAVCGVLFLMFICGVSILFYELLIGRPKLTLRPDGTFCISSPSGGETETASAQGIGQPGLAYTKVKRD